MASRQRVAITVSVPPEIAREYRTIAKDKGETISQFFREIFIFYKQEKLKDDFYRLQRYGVEKARKLSITEEEIERLVFEDR